MKKYLIPLLLFFWFANPAWATHERAGEISFKYISGLTYEITIVTYTYAPSPADRYELEISWGDSTRSILQRSNGELTGLGYFGEIIGPDLKKNLYIGIHTFPGAATYKITLEDPNRNYGIQNIPNSVEIPFFIETQLTINPFIGANSSPQLLLPPVDQGCVDKTFLHNPGAFDPDGDSLTFRLTACRGANGENIPGFVFPNQIGTNVGSVFKMNPSTGDIIWQDPKMQGEYNIAFLIEEWRNGLKIGYMTRDMQITIVTCDNNPPVIVPIHDTCVEAGDTLQFGVYASDVDNNNITLTAAGAPFEIINPAEFFNLADTTAGYSEGLFRWETKCAHVRKNPYQVYFKAVDDDKPVNLFDLKSMNITVVGPAPENLTAAALGNTILLNWDENRCANISGYQIYRRNGFVGYIPGYCETGVPAYTGYRLISTINSKDIEFTDSDVSRGIEYCYMVVAFYPDGALSYASNEACAQLKKDVPVITNISVEKTGAADGRIYLAWSKPTEIDVIQAPGPYKYLIYRSDDLNGTSFNLLDSLSSLNDTIYIDEPLNTNDQGINYRVDLYNDTPGMRFLLGPSQKASSVFLTLSPGDKKIRININTIVPWTNDQFVIYKLNESSLQFDSIATTIVPFYIDKKLVNGKSYCYKVKAIGTYGTEGITDPLINFSQETCGVAIDNERPCPPELTVQTDCEFFRNVLTWENTDPECSYDIVKYLIYYLPPQAKDLVILDSTQALAFTHINLTSIAGCYSIVAVDSVGNLSVMSDTVCVDSDVCGTYHLPNVFTPNGDELNDFFVPFPYTSVEKIDIKIVNRWGNLIFTTQDPAIRWDGKMQGTNQEVSDGVYYYVCDVYELTLIGTVKRTLRGSITVLR